MAGFRVCYVVNAVSETSVPADIARALVDYTDVKVDILAWFDSHPFEGHDRIEVTCVGAPDTVSGVNLRTLREVKRILRQYDLVQVHHNHSGSIAKLIAHSLGIPTVSREGNMRKGFNRLGRTANGITNPLSARVVCNSRAVYESFKWWETALLPHEKITIIPNGVDFDRLEAGRELQWGATESIGATNDSVLVGTAGLLTEQKDHQTLIRALALAQSQVESPLRLLIAGDGPLESELRELARDLGIADSVHFMGHLDRKQVYKMLSEIDIYAMPSRWEGFSAAAVEALAARNPAVFSDIPPFSEPYDDVARFHPVGDFEKLSDHLITLSTDEAERERLAGLGLRLVENRYTVESVAKQYRDLYEEILRTS